VSAARQITFTPTREELRERLTRVEARGASGIIFGTSGYDVERELRAYAEVARLRWPGRGAYRPNRRHETTRKPTLCNLGVCCGRRRA